MGRLLRPPKMPELPPPPPVIPEENGEAEKKRREADILRRRRGRAGTVATSWMGTGSAAGGGLKERLGE